MRAALLARLPAIGFAVIAFVVTSFATREACALHCSRRIIEEGDSSAYVRTLCGEPTAISARTEARSQTVYAVGPQGRYGSVVTVTVQIAVWLYDFGPQRFMQELTFEDDVLVSERSLGYGTVQGRPPRGETPRANARTRFALARRRETTLG